MPSETRNVFTAIARRSPSARLYSAVPRSSQCPSMVTTQLWIFLHDLGIRRGCRTSGSSRSALSTVKNTGFSGDSDSGRRVVRFAASRQLTLAEREPAAPRQRAGSAGRSALWTAGPVIAGGGVPAPGRVSALGARGRANQQDEDNNGETGSYRVTHRSPFESPDRIIVSSTSQVSGCFPCG